MAITLNSHLFGLDTRAFLNVMSHGGLGIVGINVSRNFRVSVMVFRSCGMSSKMKRLQGETPGTGGGGGENHRLSYCLPCCLFANCV